MNPIATWFYNLFKPAPLKAAEAYMERLEASIDPSRLSLTEFNRVVDEIEKDPLNPLRQLEIQSLEKYQPEHFFKYWRKIRQALSHLQEDHEQEKKSYKEQFNNINIKRIVISSQFELNQILKTEGISQLDEKTALRFQPWLDLNKKIKEKRAFIYQLHQLGTQIAQTVSTKELENLLPSWSNLKPGVIKLTSGQSEELDRYETILFNWYIANTQKLNTHLDSANALIQTLTSSDKKKYYAALTQWIIKARQSLEHEYREQIKGLYINRHFTSPPIPSLELMQLISGGLINKNDVFKSASLQPENLHQKLMQLIKDKTGDAAQQANVNAVVYTYFASTAHTQLILNYLHQSNENIIKSLCANLQEGIKKFIDKEKREPDIDEMKTLILNAVGKAIADGSCTQNDIAVLFNALKPTHAPLSNPALHAAQHFLRDTIHTKTKYGAFYSCKVTTGTWDKILILLKNKAAILKVQASVTVAVQSPSDASIDSTTQLSEPATDEESINDLIDMQRYQIFRSTKLDADEHATVAESAATHTKAPTGWFETATRKKLAESGDNDEKVAYFEAQMNSVCAP